MAAKHFLLLYDYAADYMTRRVEFRRAHLEHANRAKAKGELILGGALANPPDGAVLIFQCESTAVPEAFAEADPYVLHGLVRAWRVREWITVVGDAAITPIDPRTL
jgi:uncharacterized protein